MLFSVILSPYMTNTSGFLYLIILAGIPATTALSGTSFVTTALAATTTLLPTVTPREPLHRHR